MDTNAIKHSQLLDLVIILTTQDLKNQNVKDNHMHYIMYGMLANTKTARTESERKSVEREFGLPISRYCKGVCIHWTGLLDWTTGLTVELTFELTFERFSFQLL